MNLVKRNYSPFMSDIFDNLTERSENLEGNCFSPAANIIENKESFEVDIAVPGMDKKNIKINLEKDLLSISSEVEEKKESKKVNFTHKEFSYSKFCRTFSVPKSVDSNKIEASFENGVLNIILPKKEEAKIEINKEIKIS